MWLLLIWWDLLQLLLFHHFSLLSYRMKLLKIWIVCAVIVIFPLFSHALELYLPKDWWQTDLHVEHTRINGQEKDIITIIQVVNDYLWFWVGLIGLLLLAYSWIKILTAQGDKKQISDSYNLIIAAIIMIFVAILSRVIVKLVVNLL